MNHFAVRLCVSFLSVAAVASCAVPYLVAEDAKPVSALAVENNPPDAKAQDPSQVRAKNTVRAKGEITFDDIKLELEKDQPYEEGKMTEKVKKLHEQKVKLRGYILPTSVFQQKGIKQFVLVRDNKECCFGQVLLYTIV